MLIMGLTSSIIDALSFALFLFVFKYNSIEMASYFQTAWFVTCLITELSIIFNIRTSKIPFTESNASPKLYILTIFSMILTIITPIVLSQINYKYIFFPKFFDRRKRVWHSYRHIYMFLYMFNITCVFIFLISINCKKTLY